MEKYQMKKFNDKSSYTDCMPLCNLDLDSRSPFEGMVEFRQRSLSMDSGYGYLGVSNNLLDGIDNQSQSQKMSLSDDFPDQGDDFEDTLKRSLDSPTSGSVSSISSNTSYIQDDFKRMNPATHGSTTESCSSEEVDYDAVIQLEEIALDKTCFDFNAKIVSIKNFSNSNQTYEEPALSLNFPLGDQWLSEISKGFGVRAVQLLIESLDNSEVMEEFSAFLRSHENRQMVAKLVRQGSLRECANLRLVPPGLCNDSCAVPSFTSTSFNQLLKVCYEEMGSMMPLERQWFPRLAFRDLKTNSPKDDLATETIRVLQWNVLSQTLGTKCDKFVMCPDEALDWTTRRFRQLFEIIRHFPDIVCLQEVDHYSFLKNWLSTLGFLSFFMPKPDSPCIHMSENNGPDGCAIFYNKNKFDLVDWDKHILDVYGSKGNQVLLSVILRSKSTKKELVVSTTHLKARYNHLLMMIRREQSKDILFHVNKISRGRPIIITGDFNAEPTEPAYTVMTESENPRLASAYCDEKGSEPQYTTWKHREDGEHIETLDYIFYSREQMKVKNVLTMPSPQAIGEGRLPSNAFPSDHLTLGCDFSFIKASNKLGKIRL